MGVVPSWDFATLAIEEGVTKNEGRGVEWSLIETLNLTTLRSLKSRCQERMKRMNALKGSLRGRPYLKKLP